MHNLGTQLIETLGEDAKRTQELAQIDLILEGWGGGGEGADSKLERRLEQTCEFDSMIIKLAARIEPI